MNLKKIISSVLTVVMVLTMVVALIPVGSFAAHSPSSVTTEALSAEQIAKIVQDTTKINYSSAQQMLEDEIENGYVDSVSSDSGLYTLYVNRYTGIVYYRKNSTGEILTSNPYNLSSVSGTDHASRLLSQIVVNYHKSTETASQVMYSFSDAAARAQISLAYIDRGFRVNYTIGDTSTRVLVPVVMTAKDFEENIFKPTIEYLETSVFESIPEEIWDKVYDDVYKMAQEANVPMPQVKYVNFYSVDSHDNSNGQKFSIYDEDGSLNKSAVNQYLTNAGKILQTFGGFASSPYKGKASELYSLVMKISTNFLDKFSYYNPNIMEEGKELNELNNVLPATKDGAAFYVFGSIGTRPQDSDFKQTAEWIADCCPEYTFEDMYEHEEAAGALPYVVVAEKPVFRCSLEYYFNSDGTLSVRLPANSITFDETVYTLDSIAPLQFFGCGDLNEYGYAFIPDGSGSIIEFSDFYTPGVSREQIQVNLPLAVYGLDYCYSNLSEKATRPYEQVTMPVFGVVSTHEAPEAVTAVTGKSKVQTGYFAIMEQGASLATIFVDFGGLSYAFGTSYVGFNPYPSDTFSFDDGNSFKIVSKSKYTGSYVTRYAMLSDPDFNAAVGGGYDATYVGMATYYRDYLKEMGVLDSLRNIKKQIPLYLEALGSMEKVEQIMTFPVTVDIPLTTFDNVIDMYNELSDVKQALWDKAEEYASKSVLPGDANDLKAKEFFELSLEVENIKNVNFKLTGFANNGMYYTYPVKLDWEGVCGGRDGFINLTKIAAAANGADTTFGVYPEFDFMYINNTALFDGIDNRDNVVKMVDDRYGSKKVYDSVSRTWEQVFAMIISPDVLDRHYSTFLGKYSEYNIGGISVSTLGSDLNSNFDRDNPINRDEAQGYVEELLDRISSDYDVMVSTGNIYSLIYSDHVLDLSLDGTHFNVSSYSVPFIGMVLHSYVSYAGTAMNYSGSPDLDLLHSIENGAALYYIVCYQNTEFMKDDEDLNKYYGVSYHNWIDSIAGAYSKLNWAIGDLQSYEIVDHKILLTERNIEDSERVSNTRALLNEFLALTDNQIRRAIDAAYADMFDNPAEIGRGVELVVDVDALIAQAIDQLNLDYNTYGEDVNNEQLNKYELLIREDFAKFCQSLVSMVGEYTDYYSGDGVDPYVVTFDAIDYVTQYRYITDSKATDKDYKKTVYTIDNNQVTMVTYRNAETADEVSFIFNYNIYSVNVTLDDGTVVELPQYGFVRLDKEGTHFYG